MVILLGNKYIEEFKNNQKELSNKYFEGKTPIKVEVFNEEGRLCSFFPDIELKIGESNNIV